MDFDLMISSFPKLLSATVITLKLLSASLFFGLFIGLLFAILRLNKNPIINKFAYGYSYVFRGTPLLVQIFIIYFGLGQIEYFHRMEDFALEYYQTGSPHPDTIKTEIYEDN